MKESCKYFLILEVLTGFDVALFESSTIKEKICAKRRKNKRQQREACRRLRVALSRIRTSGLLIRRILKRIKERFGVIVTLAGNR